MSYRSPKMYSQADPTAFSKGFEAAFEKQQSAFEEDLRQREALAAEAEETLKGLYDQADLGIINGIDSTFNNALQDMLNNVVENGDFANASVGEQAKMLQDLRFKKTAMQRIGEIMGVDQEDWDLRNDPKISAFRNSLLKGEQPQIQSDGMNLKIKGSFGEITLDDIANTRLLNKSGYQETLDSINDDFGQKYNKAINEAYKQGKSDEEIQLLKDQYKQTYGSLIKNSDPDLKSYIKFNVGKSEDEQTMIDNMFGAIDEKVIDPSLIYNRPAEEADYTLGLATNLAKDVASNVPSFLRNMGIENPQMDNSGKLTYTYYQPDAEGNEQPMQAVLNVNDAGDVRTLATRIFNEQYPPGILSGQDRLKAYESFRSQLTQQLKSSITQTPTQTGADQPQGMTIDQIFAVPGETSYPELVMNKSTETVKGGNWTAIDTSLKGEKLVEVKNRYGNLTEQSLAKYRYDQRNRSEDNEKLAKNKDEATQLLALYKAYDSEGKTTADSAIISAISKALDEEQSSQIKNALGVDTFMEVNIDKLLEQVFKVKYNINDADIQTLAGVPNKEFSA